MTELLDAVEALTGRRPTDEARVASALTHPSYAHEHPGAQDYQRLEFLGDAVVGLCATRLLLERYPDLDEGSLTDLKQRVVATRTLGEVGRSLGLARLVRLGVSEARKPEVELTILGDVVEALLGVLFLEHGLDACEAAFRRWLGPRVEELRASLVAGTVKNAINRLQELTQAEFRSEPVYEVRGEGPDHARVWVASVRVDGQLPFEGRGRSKREAKANAAGLALEALSRRTESS